MPTQDVLDHQGRGVLTVDPDPVALASREVDEAGLVDVAEIACPVPTVANLLGDRVFVLVVPLELLRSGLVDHLADGFVGVQHVTVLVENCAGSLFARIGIDDDDVLARGTAQRSGRLVRIEHY